MSAALSGERLHRMGLLAFAILHWTLFAIYLWPESSSSWNDSIHDRPRLAQSITITPAS